MMGHSKVKTTLRYIILNEDDIVTRPTSLGYLKVAAQQKKTTKGNKNKKLSDLVERFSILM